MSDPVAPPEEPTPILTALAAAVEDLPPQVGRAARYVLDNPGEIAVTSMRGLAEAAGVKPNTLVRMARAVGFDSYEDFRDPFRQQAAEGTLSFPDRARFLRQISQGGSHGALLADLAKASLHNVETLFAEIDADELRAAADLIDDARRANVLGVGTARPLAENMAYVASMAVDNMAAIPVIGLAIDDVARMDERDALVAMTFHPYRTEIVDAVRLAVERSVPVIAITDSHASPLVPLARHAFVVPNDSPLPFSSNVAATALLETLLAFMVAESPADAAASIEDFHANRRAADIYHE
ncbi:MAG: MurR/RpiR family transcriptional regulator [Actinomycetota bacterium]